MKNFFQHFGAKRPLRPDAASVTGKPQFRWIIERQLAVGPIPDARLAQQLQAAGFRSVLTLCDASEGAMAPEIMTTFQWQRVVLPDSHYEEVLDTVHLSRAVSCLQAAIADHAPTYVHCLAGMERSPSVCITYLCLHQNMEVWEALNWVKQRHSRTSIQPDQLQAIQACVKQAQDLRTDR
jgi:atypical dual specificity phosphatase